MIGTDCIGLYSYDKSLGPKKEIPVVVAVYPMKVTKLLADFPERKERDLRWFSPKKAAQKVDEPELAALIASFSPRRRGGWCCAPRGQRRDRRPSARPNADLEVSGPTRRSSVRLPSTRGDVTAAMLI